MHTNLSFGSDITTPKPANTHSNLLDGFWNRPIFRQPGIALVCFAASWLGLYFGHTAAQADVFWPTNGLMLAVLLLSPRRSWPGYLAAGFVGSVSAALVFHFPLSRAVIFCTADIFEVALATILLQPGDLRRLDLTQLRVLSRFFFGSVVLAPLVSVAIVELLRTIFGSPASLLGLWNWYIGDALGIAIMTPLLLAIRKNDLMRLTSPERRLVTFVLLLAVAALSVCIFSQSQYPLTFFLFPMLLLIIFQLGSSGSAIGAFLIACPAAYYTVESRGPFSLIRTGSLLHSIFLLQGFFCVMLVIIYSVSAELEVRRQLQEELADAYRKADIIAGIDHVTELANRRIFDKEIAREWRRSARERNCISLLMLDVDYFKNFNDHYGHVAGDACLKAIAAVLSRSMLRSTDLVARYGGEEFAILLPGSNEEGAPMMAERVRQAVVAANLLHENTRLGCVTISVGVATLHPDRNSSETQIVQAADRALYHAKENGRNQISVWSDRER